MINMTFYQLCLKNLSMLMLGMAMLFCQSLLATTLPKQTVAENLNSKEAHIVISYLHAKSIDGAERCPARASSEDLWDVVVPSYDTAAAIRHLNLAERTPSELVYECCAKDFVPSEKILKEKWQKTLEFMLSSSIRKQEGIADAEVELIFPDDDLPCKEKKVVANVWIVPSEAAEELNPFAVEQIKDILTKTVFNLTAENISITH